MQPSVFDENYRIVVLDSRRQHPFGVGRKSRHDDLEPREMGKHRFQALRMLGALPPAAPYNQPYHQRHFMLTVADVVDLGGIVDNLLESRKRKLDPMQPDHRPLAGHCGADGGADAAILRYRHFDYALRTELLADSFLRSPHRRRVGNALAD